jgi:hypothetical protein
MAPATPAGPGTTPTPLAPTWGAAGVVDMGVLPGTGPRGAWAANTVVANRGLARAGDRLVTAGAGPRLTAATRAVVAPGPAFCRPPPRRLPRAEAAKAAAPPAVTVAPDAAPGPVPGAAAAAAPGLGPLEAPLAFVPLAEDTPPPAAPPSEATPAGTPIRGPLPTCPARLVAGASEGAAGEGWGWGA